MNRLLPLPAEDLPDHGVLLSRILKQLRRRKGLLIKQVAHSMGIAPRTYQLFEAGGGKLNLTRLQKFADATESDAWAILVSLAFGQPEFAVLCADNKLMTAAVVSARDFHRDWDRDIANLDPRVVMHELDTAFARLGEEARRRRFPTIDPEPDPT